MAAFREDFWWLGFGINKIFARNAEDWSGYRELRTKREPQQFGVEKKDGGSDDPGNDCGKTRVGKFAHAAAVAGELHERNHCEGQLKTENDLAEHNEHVEFGFAGNADDENSRKNRDAPRNEATKPGLEPDLEEAFHDDLPGERTGQGGVLA